MAPPLQPKNKHQIFGVADVLARPRLKTETCQMRYSQAKKQCRIRDPKCRIRRDHQQPGQCGKPGFMFLAPGIRIFFFCLPSTGIFPITLAMCIWSYLSVAESFPAAVLYCS